MKEMRIRFANKIVTQVTTDGDIIIQSTKMHRDVEVLKFHRANNLDKRALNEFYRLQVLIAPLVQNMKTSGCEWCFSMTYVHLPALTHVGERAFYACMGLESVCMDKVTQLSSQSFEYCQNLKVVRMDKVEKIAEKCFYMCSNLQIGSFAKVSEIQNGAF